MAKILLDEDFYFNLSNEFDDEKYRKKLINLLSKYLDASFVIFQPYKSFDWLAKNMKQIVELQIMKLGEYEILDSNEVADNDALIEDQGLNFSASMCNKINYLQDSDCDIIIPVPHQKHKKDIKKIADCIYVINNISQEIKSNISYFISEKKYVKNIENPNESDPLPNTDLCNEYYLIQKELIIGKNCKEQEAIFLDIGGEVLRRNQYQYNQRVTNSNRGAIRKIFSYKQKHPLYASIDVEHGAIEVYNSSGNHIDEYTYNNKPQNKQDKTGKHDIIV